MTTSGGGGFCDCGDAEAWKKGPYCQKHTPTTQSRDTEEVSHISTCVCVCACVRPSVRLTLHFVSLSGPCSSASSWPGDPCLQHFLHHPEVCRGHADLGTGRQATCRPGATVWTHTHSWLCNCEVIIVITTSLCVQGQRRHVLLHVVQWWSPHIWTGDLHPAESR